MLIMKGKGKTMVVYILFIYLRTYLGSTSMTRKATELVQTNGRVLNRYPNGPFGISKNAPK